MTNLKRILQSVSCSTFVDYFHDFYNERYPEEIMEDMSVEHLYSDNTLKTKAYKGLSIVRAGQEKAALKMVMTSKAPEHIKHKASIILNIIW